MNLRAPHSPAAERNRGPILEVLRRHIRPGDRVLEVGAGTGQHACFFAAGLSDVEWQATDIAESLPTLAAGLGRSDSAILPQPLVLDVRDDKWPAGPWHAVYTANTAHIMPWPAVCAMIAGCARYLAEEGLLIVYGPFSRGGEHTSESNLRFHHQLRDRDPAMGVRDLGDMEPIAAENGLVRVAEYAMPANNQLLVWQRGATP